MGLRLLPLKQQLASHGLFDVHVKAIGDIHIDDHHTNEDVELAIGTALLQELGDRKGINRFGDFSAPLDEALIHVSLLVEPFFQYLVNTSGMTLYIRQLAGKNSHHIIEATFKAFARALRQATEYELRRGGNVARFQFVALLFCKVYHDYYSPVAEKGGSRYIRFSLALPRYYFDIYKCYKTNAGSNYFQYFSFYV